MGRRLGGRRGGGWWEPQFKTNIEVVANVAFPAQPIVKTYVPRRQTAGKKIFHFFRGAIKTAAVDFLAKTSRKSTKTWPRADNFFIVTPQL
jgi:hypothetical protein